MARARRPSRRPGRPEGSGRSRGGDAAPATPKGIALGVLGVVGVLAGLVGLWFVTRWLVLTLTPVLYLWADGASLRIVAFLLTLWASGPLLVIAGTRLRRSERPLVRRSAIGCWVLVGLLALVLLGYIPGRGNDGRLARELDEVAGGPPFADTGQVFIGAAVAAVVCLVVLVPVAVTWDLGAAPRTRRPRRRLVLGAVGYVAAWVAAGAIVVAVVGRTPPRIDWLDTSADVLREGESGLTGEFPVGLDPSVVDVVDCDTAAARLTVDRRRPDLDGCRRALLVAATGRYDATGAAAEGAEDAERATSGRLVAVVVQVRTAGQLDDLTARLRDAEVAPGDGLPPPSGTTLTSPVSAALATVVAAEDTGTIPLPAEGAGRRPLTRALAYVLIGTSQGFYLAPPPD